MKYSIALLFTIIAWSPTCIFAQAYKPSANQVIQEKLNLTMTEYIKKCETRPGLMNVHIELRSTATREANDLSDKLVKKAKTSRQWSENAWDQLIRDYCLQNVNLQNLNALAADAINGCLDEKDKLMGERKMDFTNALFEAFCAEVKRLSKEKIAEGKN